MADEKLESVPPPQTRAVISGDDPNEHFTVAKYLRTRLTRLVPPMNPAPNPFKALALLNRQQWLFFLVAFLGWSLDAMDFFTVSLTVTDLAKTFVRAEVVGYDDFVRVGSMKEAKVKGVYRLEGKTYIVRDGDIMHILASG